MYIKGEKVSKLASFSNKTKEEIIITHASETTIFCTIAHQPLLRGFHGSWNTHAKWIFYVNQIIFFNKKEKIVETSNNVYIIKSFETNEEVFWKILEDHMKFLEILEDDVKIS
jgi:hypothetical protein